MSYGFAKEGWEVRWRDATGRHRARRFLSEEAARETDKLLREMHASARRAQYGNSGGVYPYRTASGTRWRWRCPELSTSLRKALDRRPEPYAQLQKVR